MKLSAMFCAFVMGVAFMPTADRAFAQTVNYNTSKSNSGNIAGNKAGSGKGQPGMAVKNSGVPKNVPSKVNKTTSRSNTQHN